jgi:cytochrome c oxidase cbb3-type subunit 1
MTEAASPQIHSHPSSNTGSADLVAARSSIDAALRPSVVGLFLSAVFWLLLSSLFSAVVALKLHFPEFLNWSFLSFGRLAPASEAAFTYGWCSTACMGVVVWIVSRLSGRTSPGTPLISFGNVLWNGGVLVGVASVLLGRQRALNGLEFPLAAFVIMFAGFCMIAVWLAVTYQAESEVSLSLMFISGGVLWLGWGLLTGNLLIATGSVSGVVQQIVASWVASGVQWLWITPVVLGVAYYLVPKVTGEAVFNGPMGRALFWLYFLAAGLISATRLSGGPIPLWLSSVASSASILLLVPVLGAVYNIFATARGSEVTSSSPSMRFVLFGVAVLGVTAILSALSCVKSVDYAVRLTLFDVGMRALWMRGVASMVLFGAIYYIMPRLSGCEWLSSSMISFHFLASAYGALMGAAMLVLSGLASGSALSEGDSSFSQVIELGNSYYWGHTLSYALLLAGYFAFALHFLLMAVRIGQPAGEPTLLNSDEH